MGSALTAPLFESLDPRLSGASLVLGSFAASGSLLVLVGAWTPLFELIAGSRQLTGGRLSLAGQPAEGAARRGDVGLVRHDVPLPPGWPARDVLCASAELLGHSRRRANQRARQVLGELGLEELAGKRPVALRPAEQRAIAIAAAVLGAPAVLAIEEPFAGLEPSGQAYVDAVIGRALHGRAGLVSVRQLPGTPSEDALAARSDELLFAAGERLVVRGSYRELSSRARSYRVVVHHAADALLARLAEAGYEVRRMASADVTTLWLTDRASLGTLPVFRASLAVEAPILELVPLALPEPPSADEPGAPAAPLR